MRPMVIWLRERELGIEYLVVRDGEDSRGWQPSRWDNVRGAQRGMTSQSIEMGYLPAGRWIRDPDGEWRRRFVDGVIGPVLGGDEFPPGRLQTGLTAAQLYKLSRGHVRRALEANLAEGWPLAEEFGYSEADAAAIASEIRKFIDKYTG